MAKTAIEVAIEDIKYLRDRATDPLVKIAYNMAITVCEQQIEDEKKQIVDAYNGGDFMATTKERLDYDEADHEYKDAETYFTNTFKQ